MAPSHGQVIEARVVERENRFVCRVVLTDDTEHRAYLPNTARLTDVLVPGRRALLELADDPARTTRFTLTRVWDGTWVSLEAAHASALLADHVEQTGRLDPFGPVTAIEREVALAGQRLDLRLRCAGGTDVWVEVKSLSRADGGDAPLSATPSTRATRHLRLLADLAADDVPAAVAFVVQRGDVRRLVVDERGDPDWVETVRTAHAAGVTVLAFACRVEERRVAVDRPLPVVIEPPIPSVVVGEP